MDKSTRDMFVTESMSVIRDHFQVSIVCVDVFVVCICAYTSSVCGLSIQCPPSVDNTSGINAVLL